MIAEYQIPIYVDICVLDVIYLIGSNELNRCEFMGEENISSLDLFVMGIYNLCDSGFFVVLMEFDVTKCQKKGIIRLLNLLL